MIFKIPSTMCAGMVCRRNQYKLYKNKYLVGKKNGLQIADISG